MSAQQNQQDRLIKEEQKVLDDLIRLMDELMLKKNRQLTRNMLEQMKAKSKMQSGLAEAYGDLVSANLDYAENLEDKKRMGQSRHELYSYHMILRQIDPDHGLDRDVDIKVGLHNYNHGPGDPLILGWFMPLCRYFVLNDEGRTFEVTKDGVHTEYTLELKRKVDIVFDKVVKVVELYSIFGNNEEKVIADEFLQELLSRRSESEFQNIVFSIQKKQGEIISAPFSKNMIIQGCAGSGKSMIMLHRLPIVLFDNQETLSRSSLYVITPSETYIQMARNMMVDLEISDIPMGTIGDYFDRVIGRYGIDLHDGKNPSYYGKGKSYNPLPEEQERYVYSQNCVQDIRNHMQELIDAGQDQEFISEKVLDILTGKDVEKEPYYSGKIHKIQLGISDYSNRDWADTRKLIQNIRSTLKKMEDVRKVLNGRKEDIRRTFSYLKKRGTEDLRTKTARSRSHEMNLPENSEKLQRLLDDIEAQKGRVRQDEEALLRLDSEPEYFQSLFEIAHQLADDMQKFEYLQQDISQIDRKRMLQLISRRSELIEISTSAAERLDHIIDPFPHNPVSLHSLARRLREATSDIEEASKNILSAEDLQKLQDASKYFTEVSEKMVRSTYTHIMEKLSQKPDDLGITALSCSPYLYSQILYQFCGAPNTAGENLITIDEAQTLTPAEMQLIQNVNGNRVILNLFGDVHQHIEGSKGVDSWEELNRDHRFEVRTLDENYRNACEITNYCNRRFGLDMQAINTSGNGVHEIHNLDELQNALEKVFTRPLESGYNCIIVKDNREADSLKSLEKVHLSQINDMTDQQSELDIRKWNLMTGSQAKGLEFSAVIAISGRMSRNEKYIAYTRAMNELYVYDEELSLEETHGGNNDSEVSTGEEMNGNTQRKTSNETSSHGIKELLLSGLDHVLSLIRLKK